jgi:hypothetical protein
MSTNPGHDSFSRPHRMPDCTGIRERTRSANYRHEVAEHRSGNAAGCDANQELSGAGNSDVGEGLAERCGRPRRSPDSHERWL